MGNFTASWFQRPIRNYRLWQSHDGLESPTGLTEGLSADPIRLKPRITDRERKIDTINEYMAQLNPGNLADDENHVNILLMALDTVRDLLGLIADDSAQMDLERLETKLCLALVRHLGIELHMTVADQEVVSGQKIPLNLIVWNHIRRFDAGTPVLDAPASVSLDLSSGWEYEDRQWKMAAELSLGDEALPTRPMKKFLYDREITQPFGFLSVPFQINGTIVPVSRPINVDVFPDVSMTAATRRALAFPGNAGRADLEIVVTNHSPSEKEFEIRTISSAGIDVEPSSINLKRFHEDESLAATFKVKVPRGRLVSDPSVPDARWGPRAGNCDSGSLGRPGYPR